MEAEDAIGGVLVVGGIAAAIGVGVALARRGSPSSTPPSPPPRAREAAANMTTKPSVEPGSTSTIRLEGTYTPGFWAIILSPRCAVANIPLAFALSSIAEESGGNPCAIGRPDQYGPDGKLPREMGIYQFYNPDDFSRLKVNAGDLRAYCNPNLVTYTLHDQNGKAYQVKGPSQEVARPLTAAELSQQADMTVGKINDSRSRAAHAMSVSGTHWPTSGDHQVDFWRLVKLDHGLPGIMNAGLHNFAAKHGRGPSSWAEFRHAVESGDVHCDEVTERYRAKFGSIFDNAEHACAGVSGGSIA